MPEAHLQHEIWSRKQPDIGQRDGRPWRVKHQANNQTKVDVTDDPDEAELLTLRRDLDGAKPGNVVADKSHSQRYWQIET